MPQPICFYIKSANGTVDIPCFDTLQKAFAMERMRAAFTCVDKVVTFDGIDANSAFHFV